MTSQAAVPPEGYAYETCGPCQGKGGFEPFEPCPPCGATGRVLVHQPPIRCPRCGGDGKAKSFLEGLNTDSRLCVICCGTGWALSLTS